MQALILAAGLGRRLGELTKNNTKCMIQANGVRLIDRMLTQLSRHSLRRVVIVVGYHGDELIEHIGDRYADKLDIQYVFNPIYDRTNNIYSLALAKEQLQQDDTLLLESDLIFEDSLLDLILDDPYPNIALVAKYETWMDGTMVRIDPDCNILNFIPKTAFRYEDVPYYYKTVNIYKFSRSFSKEQYVPFLEAYSKAMGNNEYYEQVLRILTALDRTDLKALPIGRRKWYEIDDVQDLDIAEAIFSPSAQKLDKLQKRYGGYWRFPGLLDFCYLVNPYFPTPRMRDEMRANFDALLAQYPSGMNVNTLLAAKYFGLRQPYVTVGNGAAEIIKSLMAANADGLTGVVQPTFEEYPNRLEPSRVVRFEAKPPCFAYTAADLMAFFADKGISCLVVVNPDNPSGNFMPAADVLKLAGWCAERGIRLVADESFVDFTRDFRGNTLLRNDVLEAYPNMVVVKSISKSYGVPGLRLGIAASSCTALIDGLRRDASIWNINSFAEFYMQIFAKYEDAYYAACDRFAAERDRFMGLLNRVPWLRPVPSQANYFMCQVLPPFTARSLTERLLEQHNMLIKDLSPKRGFEGLEYVRIAVRDSADNDALAAALASLMP